MKIFYFSFAETKKSLFFHFRAFQSFNQTPQKHFFIQQLNKVLFAAATTNSLWMIARVLERDLKFAFLLFAWRGSFPLLLYLQSRTNKWNIRAGNFKRHFSDELSFVISQLNVIKYALISGLEFTPFVPLNVESHFRVTEYAIIHLCVMEEANQGMFGECVTVFWEVLVMLGVLLGFL